MCCQNHAVSRLKTCIRSNQADEDAGEHRDHHRPQERLAARPGRAQHQPADGRQRPQRVHRDRGDQHARPSSAGCPGPRAACIGLPPCSSTTTLITSRKPNIVSDRGDRRRAPGRPAARWRPSTTRCRGPTAAAISRTARCGPCARRTARRGSRRTPRSASTMKGQLRGQQQAQVDAAGQLLHLLGAHLRGDLAEVEAVDRDAVAVRACRSAIALRAPTSPTMIAISVSSSEMPPATSGAQKKPPLCSQNSRLSSSLNLWVGCGAATGCAARFAIEVG